jgi:glycosyltransferase involved in cell wall biosynthesis
VNILLWHVHGSWTTSLVQGPHSYLLPLMPDRGPDGRGRATSWDWPASTREVPYDRLRDEAVDVVVLQRPHEIELATRWLGRHPGRQPGCQVPAVYVEHNTPKGDVPLTRHPLANRDDVPLVHVTHFNELFWDNGAAPTTVIEHGIVDPGPRWTGELERAAAVVNEPLRRGRVTGTDLLPRFAAAAPLDVFGMRTGGLAGPNIHAYDLPQRELHDALARRRVYVHPVRWTSLGLCLLEAMQLGMPVVALATTEAVEAVPAGAGVVSTRVDHLVDAVHSFRSDHALAGEYGRRARAAATRRYGLSRFLDDWDRLFKEVTG